MRSWAFFIFEAATISMALVILRVFCTLLILVRISLLAGLIQRSVGGIFLEVLDRLVQLVLVFLGEVLARLNAVDEIAILALDVGAHGALGGKRFLHVDVVEVAVVYRKQRQRHFPYLQRLVLRLLHEFGHHAAAFELLAGGFVKVGGELRERRKLAILGKREPHAAAELLDHLGLRSAAHA